MGGKIWSAKEEKYFWRVLVPQSPNRVGADRARPERSWADLARDMRNYMGTEARREYNGVSLFEHWFQNIRSNRPSPNAGKFVREYRRKMGETPTLPPAEYYAEAPAQAQAPEAPMEAGLDEAAPPKADSDDEPLLPPSLSSRFYIPDVSRFRVPVCFMERQSTPGREAGSDDSLFVPEHQETTTHQDGATGKAAANNKGGDGEESGGNSNNNNETAPAPAPGQNPRPVSLPVNSRRSLRPLLPAGPVPYGRADVNFANLGDDEEDEDDEDDGDNYEVAPVASRRHSRAGPPCTFGSHLIRGRGPRVNLPRAPAARDTIGVIQDKGDGSTMSAACRLRLRTGGAAREAARSIINPQATIRSAADDASSCLAERPRVARLRAQLAETIAEAEADREGGEKDETEGGAGEPEE